MGYDDYECLLCYLKGNGNNPTDSSGHICLSCVAKANNIGGRATGRVVSALNGNVCMFKRCDVCDVVNELDHLGFYISLCSSCEGSNRDNDNSSYNSSDE